MPESRLRSVVLISDFGDSPYTGIMRGVIKSIDPGIDVIDGTHGVPNFSALAGAYVVYNMYRWMPKESVIVAVIDPGVGGSRKALAVKAGDYYFVGPDNGVLYPAIAREGFQFGVALDYASVNKLATSKFKGKLPPQGWRVSDTFHGRDVFAPAAALIAINTPLDVLGVPISQSDMRKLTLEAVERQEEGYRLKIIYIDKFGNIALSATQGALPLRQWQRVAVTTSGGAMYQAVVGRKFSDVSPGDLVIYVNSFGFVEIAANQDSAARKMGVSIGDKVGIVPI
ncbi:MAG: SAM-dependent chlorinase/fluorinase [Desulfurococcales archaeon]|nr:SAM-dependent chlorinase/fluorinase [Desulfurococcales archaeon]